MTRTEFTVMADLGDRQVAIETYDNPRDAAEMSDALDYVLGRHNNPARDADDQAARCLAAATLVFAGVSTERTRVIIREYLGRSNRVH